MHTRLSAATSESRGVGYFRQGLALLVLERVVPNLSTYGASATPSPTETRVYFLLRGNGNPMLCCRLSMSMSHSLWKFT